MVKICFRCKQEIMEGSNYYSFTEYNREEIISVNYAHKECWDKFLNQLTTLNEAQGMLKGLKSSLTKMGMLPKEEKEVVII